jgi:hypothetical protein
MFSSRYLLLEKCLSKPNWVCTGRKYYNRHLILFLFLLTDDPNFLAAAKEAADKAVTCGVEINFECSNYAINLKPSVGDSIKVI